MPTSSVADLRTKYRGYLDAGAATDADFRNALDEVMPRIYQMGFWRDMMTTLEEVDVSSGYYTLLADVTSTGVGYDSILAVILDDSPTVLYSIWHDYRMFGEPSTTAASDVTSLMAGVFDDGYSGAGGRRRYRISPVDSDTKATLLMKRKWVDVAIDAHLVFLPNDSTIIKHGLLGKLAEDNADIERAEYHWQTAQRLLEADIDSYRGGARPKVTIAPEGVGSGMRGMY
jgi:hypothetical protein